MKKVFILTLLLFLQIHLTGQSIERELFTNTSEVQTLGGSAIIRWSIGEPISENYLSTNHIAQGFQEGVYDVVLPIYLSDFEAIRRDFSTVYLSWEAAFRGKFNGFWVERKLEEEPDFTILQFIEKNALEGDLEYELIDANDYHKNSYYRLKMVEIGAFEYSKIKMVEGSPLKHQIVVFPNPTSERLALSVLSDMRQTHERITLIVTSSIGHIILQKEIIFSPRISLGEIARFDKGIYSIQIYLDGEYFSTQYFAKI